MNPIPLFGWGKEISLAFKNLLYQSFFCLLPMNTFLKKKTHVKKKKLILTKQNRYLIFLLLLTNADSKIKEYEPMPVISSVREKNAMVWKFLAYSICSFVHPPYIDFA